MEVVSASVELNDRSGVRATTSHVPLLPALRRLDRLLDLAVKSMQPAQGPVGSAPFRGLFIDRAQVDRLLSQEPGATQFRLVHEFPDEDSGEVSENDSALSWLIRSFGLSRFAADVILLALAPEIDLRYEKIYAYLQDDVTRKRPTVELALNLLCSSVDEKLASGALQYAPRLCPVLCHWESYDLQYSPLSTVTFQLPIFYHCLLPTKRSREASPE